MMENMNVADVLGTLFLIYGVIDGYRKGFVKKGILFASSISVSYTHLDVYKRQAYSPTEGKYKVYIIDEVHMLSIGAFNALLKTLEEPPSYVIFILATTEAHKIPVTILSRCQRYDFRRITTETITDRLKELMAVSYTHL